MRQALEGFGEEMADGMHVTVIALAAGRAEGPRQRRVAVEAARGCGFGFGCVCRVAHAVRKPAARASARSRTRRLVNVKAALRLPAGTRQPRLLFTFVAS